MYYNRIEKIFKYSKELGADHVEVMIQKSRGEDVSCRNGSIETINKKDSLHTGIRILKNSKQIIISTSDISDLSLKETMEKGMEVVKFVDEDPYCGLGDCFSNTYSLPYLDCYDFSQPRTEDLIERVKIMENVAFRTSGITNIENCSAGWNQTLSIITNTKGFFLSFPVSNHFNSLSIVSGESEDAQTDSDKNVKVYLEDLYSPEDFSSKVTNMAIKKLNPRKIKSQRIPVIFHPRAGKIILRYFTQLINGVNIVQEGKSYLQGHLGKQIFSSAINIIDDPHLIRGLRSLPVDFEGSLCKKKMVVESGVLKSWLLDLRSSRKIKMQSTGNAKRSINDIPRPYPTNFYIAGGFIPKEDLFKLVKKAFYVTDLMGSGFDKITGNYSEGAKGFWIENGEIAYPINKVAIAGNFKEMFQNIVVANDLYFEYDINTPTFLIEEMILSGTD